MHPFLTWPPQSRSYVPARLYAKLDELEPLQPTPGLEFIFGCLDADWFDSNRASLVGKRGMTRALAIDQMPVFYLESDHVPPTLSSPGLDDILQRLSASWDDWFEIKLSSTPPNARLYPNLFGDPLHVRITSCRRADAPIVNLLQEVHDLDEWQVSDIDLQSAHAQVGSPGFELFAVYDVGQGSANGICPASAKPVVYFDFGGGVRRHRSTRPHSTPSFCLCSTPQIVLSHWDADHWSSGPLQPASLSLTWTAPLQSVSSPHLSFAGSIITAKGRLLVWAGGAGSNFSIGNAAFRRAGGSSRNDSGIWLLVKHPNLGDPFVFPGDADYLHLGATAPARA